MYRVHILFMSENVSYIKCKIENFYKIYLSLIIFLFFLREENKSIKLGFEHAFACHKPSINFVAINNFLSRINHP